MTGTELLTLVRTLIQERTEDKQLDTEIETFLNVAYRKWVAKINSSNYKWFVKSGSLSLTSGSREATLASDCIGDVYLIDDENALPVIEKDPADFYSDASGTPNRAALIDGNTIIFNYKASGDKTYPYYYYYEPTAISKTGSTEIDFPTLHHALLAYEAAISVRIRKNQRIDELLAIKNEMAQTLIESLNRRIDGTPFIPITPLDIGSAGSDDDL